MSLRHTIKRHDTLPTLRVQATAAGTGTAVDLSDAVAKFVMRRRAGDPDADPLIDRAATIEDAMQGILQYAWQVGDTATAGQYDGEFQVTYNDGSILTVPSDGFIRIAVVEDLG